MPFLSDLNAVSHERVVGWAWDSDDPQRAVSLYVTVDGDITGRSLANRHRADLERAGIGGGRHAFEFRFEPPLSILTPHSIAVFREGDGTQLASSPRVIEAFRSFDPATRDAIARLLATPGEATDIRSRLDFLLREAERLKGRLAETVGQMPANGDRGRTPADRAPQALVIDERLPKSDRDAGSNAILSHMRALQRLGYEVTFLPADLAGDAADLSAEGIQCCLAPVYGSVEEVLKAHAGGFALVYLHRVAMAARYVTLVRSLQPKSRVIYSVADLHHLRFARRAAVEDRPELRQRSEHLRIAETVSAWQSDAVITHSIEEAAILGTIVDAAKVHVVPWAIPPRPVETSFAARRGFAFVGGFAHDPNVDGAHWLIDHVLPELEAGGEGIACLLVGSDMPRALRAIHRPLLDPTGHVADLSTIFERVRLTVAPLAYGAGVKGKVLDSLAAGIPCVCTPIAAEGLDLPAILLQQVASSPAEFAEAIRRLHEDEALNRACSDAGLAFIAEAASEDRIDRQLRRVAGLL